MLAVVCSCADFLEPDANGEYNSENYTDYPAIIRGYVDKAFNLLPYTYYTTEYVLFDAITDDACFRDKTQSVRKFGAGLSQRTSHPLSAVWNRNWQGIYYVNLFLEDNIGMNTRYLTSVTDDAFLRRYLQGDAYALRAYYHFDLLKRFGGVGENGKLLGVPVITSPVKAEEIESAKFERASFDDCVAQILADCDSAYKYLPLSNRDFLIEPGVSTSVGGSVRYKCFDKVAVDGLRAMVYLLWASPAFNPSGDTSRWEKAAGYAYDVMKHKLTVESTVTGGFNPAGRFQWTDTDSPEIVWCSRSSTGQTIEKRFYPQGFNGTAEVVPTQELVDAFPAANGYPINDVRSGYDPQNPYEGRDPRFYSTIFYNGSLVRRTDNDRISYIFDTSQGGKDASGGVGTSPTNYYIKKFVHLNWNLNDDSVQNGNRGIFFIRWTHMCLIYAEALNEISGPLSDLGGNGLSAKDAIAYLRNRPTTDNKSGLGQGGDPYLDECAASADAFRDLVRNEWRVETCFEGLRFINLRRWNTPLDELNAPVHAVVITRNDLAQNVYDYSTVADVRSYPSQWLPLPYADVKNSGGSLVQNEGWSLWK